MTETISVILNLKMPNIQMKQTEEILNKLKEISSPEPSPWLDEARKRRENKQGFKKSYLTAVQILRTLRERGMTQKELALKMNVSPQVVNKWIKGKENFTYDTIAKIEEVLGINITNIKGEEAAPYETYKGKDAQLDLAIKLLKEEVKKNPVYKPKAPKYPDKSFKGERE